MPHLSDGYYGSMVGCWATPTRSCPAAPPVTRPGSAALSYFTTRSHKLKKILLPLDGSQLSQRALDPALALCRQTSAELLLVRVPAADTLSFALGESKHHELAQDALAY